MNDLKSYALGSHGWFVPENTAFTSPGPGGVVAVNLWPDKDDPIWDSKFIGDTEDFDDKKNVEEVEVKKPAPGVLVTKDILTLFQSLEFMMTTNSLRRLAIQIMYGSAIELTDAVGEFVPLSAPPPSGLLKLQRYTHENELVFAADLWVRAKVEDAMKGGNNAVVKPKFTFRLLDSPLNSMFFGDPALLG